MLRHMLYACLHRNTLKWGACVACPRKLKALWGGGGGGG